MEQGADVTLFEAAKSLGGRVMSFRDPDSGLLIDNCCHVILGCCTEAIGFLERIGSLDKVEFHGTLNVGDELNRLIIEACRFPAPVHLLPSIVRSSYLSSTDKLCIAQILAGMLYHKPGEGEAAIGYLKRLGCSERLFDRLFEPVIVSALNETINCASAKYARMVLLESFLKDRRSYRLGVPKVPQGELIGKAATRWLEAKGAAIRLLGRVKAVHVEDGLVRSIELDCGENLVFDAYVAAVPPNALNRMGIDAGGGDRLAWQPIVSAHLFFADQIPAFEPVCIIKEPFGWVFGRRPNVGYVEVVASAAGGLMKLSKNEVIAHALRAASKAVPALSRIPLKRGIVYRAGKATFGTLKCDTNRPGAVTPMANLFVAGDWTNTGWPATIESAVRSGLAAARALIDKI